tara:strand:+ start:257 stop:433 length:177 start_codon:yes stop_codon:yes gene_type:complete
MTELQAERMLGFMALITASITALALPGLDKAQAAVYLENFARIADEAEANEKALKEKL